MYTVSAEDDVNFVMLATLESQPQQARTSKQHAAFIASLQQQWSKLVALASDHKKQSASSQTGIHAETVTDIDDAIERTCLGLKLEVP